MKRLLWAIVIALLATSLWGCGAYSQEEAIFVAHNRSSDRVAIIVDGREVFQLPGNSAGDFTVVIDVAHSRFRERRYGPSQIDKLVDVTVAFKNLRTGRLSPDAYCTAGAKVKTNVFYEITNFNPDGRASCNYSQTIGGVEVVIGGSQ